MRQMKTKKTKLGTEPVDVQCARTAENAVNQLVKKGCHRDQLLIYLEMLLIHLAHPTRKRHLFGFDQTPDEIERAFTAVRAAANRIRRLNEGKALAITRAVAEGGPNIQLAQQVSVFDQLPSILADYIRFVQEHVDHCRKTSFSTRPFDLSKWMLVSYVRLATGNANVPLLSKLICAAADAKKITFREKQFTVDALNKFSNRHREPNKMDFLSPYFAASEFEPGDEVEDES